MLEDAQIDPNEKLCWTGCHVASRIGDGLLLMHLEHGTFYELPVEQAEIWRSLEQPTSLSTLLDVIAGTDNPDLRGPIEVYLQQFLRLLLDNDLVEIVDSGNPTRCGRI